MPPTHVRKFVFLFGSFLFTANLLTGQIISPRINGLDMGAKYPDIVRKLGRPLSDRRGGKVPCGGAMRTLYYNGLVLRLETGGRESFGLYKVEVTSSKWAVSGIRVGASRSELVKKFGRGPYFINEGFARFYFRKNRLIKMQWEFNFC